MAKVKVLLFSGGEIHNWQGVGNASNDALSESSEFEITRVDQDLSVFAGDLTAYDVIVFYYTVGEITDAQFNGISNFVKSGKGFVGIHSAADSFRNSPDWRAFIGGHFINHPHFRTYQVSVLDDTHPITEGIDEFMATDEQYITDYDPRNNILATGLYKGVAHPVVWTKDWGVGRVAYIALGHDEAPARHETFKLLLKRAATWAAKGGK